MRKKYLQIVGEILKVRTGKGEGEADGEGERDREEKRTGRQIRGKEDGNSGMFTFLEPNKHTYTHTHTEQKHEHC